MLASLHVNFSNHPHVYVCDLGMSKTQINELRSVRWVTLLSMPHFAPFWNECFSWHQYIYTQPRERNRLHIDAGVVVLRPLEAWFLSIKKHGYIAFSQGQTVVKTTPLDYFDKFGLDCEKIGLEETFASGVFGHDAESFAADAVKEVWDLAQKGWCLGYSKSEIHRAGKYDNILRDCDLFRQDQTLLNLSLRKHAGGPIIIRKPRLNLGLGTPDVHPRQYVWHSRRHPLSLKFMNVRISENVLPHCINRFFMVGRLKMIELLKLIKMKNLFRKIVVR